MKIKTNNMEYEIMHVSIGNTTFTCPYCNQKFGDDNDFFYNRISKNKSGYTKHLCFCNKKFGVTYTYKGDMMGFKL